MTLNSILRSGLLLSMMTFVPLSFAGMAQGGDIANGALYHMSAFDMISYYKDGKSGEVRFTCDLEGDGVYATLEPGKNFEGNSYGYLTQGVNGPYHWTLRDKGASNGNIKVMLLKGDKATIQCKQI